MSWIYLALAIGLEVGGTTCMKLSDGLTRWAPSVGMVVLYGASFTFLTLSLKHLEIGMAYAIWAGLGTALISLVGIALFSESASPLKFGCIGLIIVGVVGLYLSGGGH
jgi:small multidrug resistance pump